MKKYKVSLQQLFLLYVLYINISQAITNTVQSATLVLSNNLIMQQSHIAFTVTVGTNLPMFTAGDCLRLTITNPYQTTDATLKTLETDYNSFETPNTAITCSSLTTNINTNCVNALNTVSVLYINLGTTVTTTIKSFSGTIANFRNPFSSVATTWKLGYLNGCTGSPQNEITNQFTFTAGTFNVDTSPDIVLSPSSTTIGDKSTQLTVKFRPSTILLFKGKIELTVPAYYQDSNGASTDSVISNEASNPPVVTSSDGSIVIGTGYTFRPTDRILTLDYTTSSSSKVLPASTWLQFTVTNFQNPISRDSLGGFYLRTSDPYGNTVDNSASSVSLSGVTTPAKIVTAQLSIRKLSGTGNDLQIAQSDRQLEISFDIGFPIEYACYIRYCFPVDIRIDNDDTLDTFEGGGFIAQTIPATDINKIPYIIGDDLSDCSSNYLVLPGCTDYSFIGASGQGVITMSAVVSPAQLKDTDSFHIEFYKDQALNNLIATTRTNTGMNLNFDKVDMTGGLITCYTFSAVSDKTIQTVTDFIVEFKIQTNLYVDSIIEITAPTSTKTNLLVGAACNIISTSYQFDSTRKCLVTGTSPPVFQIYSMFSSSRTDVFALIIDTPAAANITLLIEGIVNPTAVQDAGSWSVSTYNVINGVKYKVDTSVGGSTGTTSYTSTIGTLTAASNGITPSDRTTYSSTGTYTLQIQLGHSIPLNGKVQLTIPTDFAIVTASLKCEYFDSTTNAFVVKSCSSSSMTITMSMSLSADHPSTTILIIRLTGIRNPRTFKPTDSIQILTTDSSGNPIDSGQGFSTSMNVANSMAYIKMSSISKVNGAITDYTVEFSITSLPLSTGDQLSLTFPDYVNLPNGVKCVQSSMITSLVCTNSGQTLIVKMVTLTTSLTVFRFTVRNVQNPPSTKVSGWITSVYITDKDGYMVAQLPATFTSATIQNTIAGTINVNNTSLYQDNLGLGVVALYRLEFTPNNSISSTGSMKIGYPQQITIDAQNFTCSVTTNVKYQSVCTLDTTNRKISIVGAFSGIGSTTRFSGSVMIELYPVTNPINNAVLNGFTIDTFDDGTTMSQKIDSLADNLLKPKTECNYPCKTCLGSDPNYCLSCWASDNTKFLQYEPSTNTQVCKQTCDSGYTTNGDPNLVCLACDPTCATCLDAGSVGDKFKCVKCADSTPFQYPDKKCMRTCDSGYYEAQPKKCQPCSDPCFSCNGTATTCLDCKKDGKNPFLYNKTCLTKCNDFFAGVDNQCLACQSPCSKCVNSTTQCLNCDQSQSMKYWFSYSCYKDCPSGTVQDSKLMVCKGCLSGCAKCDEFNQTKCYQCINPLILYKDQCLTNCPDGLQLNDAGDDCIIQQGQIKDLTLVYFPFLICVLLMYIVSAGGEIKDRKNVVLSNSIVLWGPIEQLALVGQVALSYIYDGGLIFYASAGVFGINLIINFIFSKRLNAKVIEPDEEFKFWRQLHPKTANFIIFMSSYVSFKMIRLTYSYLYGFDVFKARFSDPGAFEKVIKRWTYPHILLCNIGIIGVDAFAFYMADSFAIDTQYKIMLIETAAISFLMIIFQGYEFCILRKLLEYEYNTMESESGEGFSRLLKEEESVEKQRRRDMLKRIMQQFKGNQDLINEVNNGTKVDDLMGGHKLLKPRRCNSMADIKEEIEADPREIKSEPPGPKPDWEQEEPKQLAVDNVYAESKPADPVARIGKTYSDVGSQVIPDEFGRIITRKGVDFLSIEGPDGQNTQRRRKDKNKKRGRKNQYYTQIDAEDDEEAEHLEDTQKEVKFEDEDNLGVIREEENEDDNKRKTMGNKSGRDMEKQMNQLEEEKAKKEAEDQARRAKEEAEAQRLEEEISKQQKMIPGIKPTEEDPIVQVPPDSNKRNFNEHDILGEFDRDEKGNIILLQDNDGNCIDKKGNRVNERGYLIDPNTGDIIENHDKQKMFDKEDIDDRGEIPAPYCLEKYNFNPFKMRGDLDIDRTTKKPIILKNKSGQLVDKQGRLVNSKGWLINKEGHIVDFMGVKKFDKKQLQEDGDMHRLFNYAGSRFDINDVCGVFDFDRNTGLIKLKTNKQGQHFDNLGRLVNARGYLVDFQGNVVDVKGKRVFEKKYVGANGEIPKIFPFTKFNLKNILGEFEMDPLGNPILEKNPEGQLIDRDGKRVNGRGYFCDQQGNIIDKRGKIMFDKQILDPDGEIPEVFRTGLLKSDSAASSLSRLMSEIERNQPEEVYNNDNRNQTQELSNNEKKKKQVIFSKGSGGGNTSVESLMEDTPSNYDKANMRLHSNRRGLKILDDQGSQSVLSGIQERTKKVKRKKKVVQEYSAPSDKDIQLAKAYGGVAKGAPKRQVPKGLNTRGINSPSSSMSRQSKKLKVVSGSVAGFQRNQHNASQPQMEESKMNQNQSMVLLNETGDPSMMAVPEHHLREQRLKKQKMQELKQRKKLHAQKGGPGDADFEKMFGKDIDEFLEDSDWDIESFENMSMYSRGTARSAFLDGRIRGLESIYLQRIESSQKRGGLKTKKTSNKPKFRVMQDRFIDDPAAMPIDSDAQLNDMSSQHSRKVPAQIGVRNKMVTSQTQYREGAGGAAMFSNRKL